MIGNRSALSMLEFNRMNGAKHAKRRGGADAKKGEAGSDVAEPGIHPNEEAINRLNLCAKILKGVHLHERLENNVQMGSKRSAINNARVRKPFSFIAD